MRRPMVAVAVAAALVAGCGGAAQDRQAQTPPRVGFTGTGAGSGGTARPVDVGGRSLFVDCEGSGSPTVILEAGLPGSSKNWVAVMPALRRITRTCAYDRAGSGSSLPPPGVNDAARAIADLERLLSRGRIAPPYVLVGHSYGGLLARLFARAHPGETAGLVLVDAMGRDQTRRQLAVWPRSEAPAARRDFAQPVSDGVDLRAGEDLAAGIRTLGRVPLAVITAGRQPDMASLPAPGGPALLRLWTTMQDELAGLSSNHVHVVALRSDHFVQQYSTGQPGVVIRAVAAVVRAARDGLPLPPCPQLFHGPGVRCAG